MSSHMDDKQFQQLAEVALHRILSALEPVEDLGLDESPDTLKIEFPDRTKLIINRHTAARQIWLAAPSGAWHFAPDNAGARWIDVRTGVELFAELGTLIESMLGRAVKF